MEDPKDNAPEDKTKKDNAAEPLPFCTSAPDPEHARSRNDDEPCDDGRSGT